MSILVIDYGMGNLGSVRRSLEECGASVVVSSSPESVEECTKIILPGVGAFADGMRHLHQTGWVEAIDEAVSGRGVPILGICLGMQLLASVGHEGGENPGLGLIPGVVKRLEPNGDNIRIPHVGWNEVHRARDNELLAGVPDKSDFYFVHSYHFIPDAEDNVVATTPYCGGFASMIARNNVYGVQFHPEKSSRPGFQLLRDFLGI